MILSYYNIAKCREDITEYVYHFTKGVNALGTLQQILEEGSIKDMQEREKEDYRICFTESPLKMQSTMFQTLESDKSFEYAPYGIGIKKELLFKEGARPVIYGKYNEINDFPPNMHWRFVSYTPNIYDYSWQREWRLPKKEFCINPQNCIVIVKSKEEQQLLFEPLDIIMDGDVCDGEYHCSPTLKTERKYRSISLEEVEELNNKKDIEDIIEKQHLGEKLYTSLGYL